MNIWHILFLLIPVAVNGGFYSDEYNTHGSNAGILLFDLEPDATSEAMGKTSSGAESISKSAFYNPAYSALTDGVKLSNIYIWHNLDFIHPKHFMINGGIHFNNYLNAEISTFNHIVRDTLEEVSYKNDQPVQTDTIEYLNRHSIHSLHYGIHLPFNLCIGIGASLFRTLLTFDDDTYSWSGLPVIDIGFFYPINIQTKKKYKHRLLFDVVHKNLFDTKVHNSYSDTKEVLPIELILGLGYEIDIKSNAPPYGLSPVTIVIQSKYRELINCRYNSRIGFGMQVSVLEMAKIRIGYYSERIEKGAYSNSRESLQDFTYGFGLSVPLFKLMSKPILPDITVDLTTLKQPTRTGWVFEKNFVSIATSLNWRVFQNRHSNNY